MRNLLFWIQNRYRISLMYILYFVIIFPGKEAGYLKILQSFSPKDALCKVWLKLALWIYRRIFLNLVNVFSLFCNYLSLEKKVILYLYKCEFPLPKDCALCFGWNCPVGLEKKNFKFGQCIFAISSISTWKKAWLFIWTNLNPLHLRMLCAEFGWNWPKWSDLYIYLHAIDCSVLINIALGATWEDFPVCFDHSLRQSARYLGVEKQLYNKKNHFTDLTYMYTYMKEPDSIAVVQRERIHSPNSGRVTMTLITIKLMHHQGIEKTDEKTHLLSQFTSNNYPLTRV